MNEKTMGQIAYEAFQQAFLPKGVTPATWENCSDDTKNAWDAAADAVINEREGDREPPGSAR